MLFALIQVVYSWFYCLIFTLLLSFISSSTTSPANTKDFYIQKHDGGRVGCEGAWKLWVRLILDLRPEESVPSKGANSPHPSLISLRCSMYPTIDSYLLHMGQGWLKGLDSLLDSLLFSSLSWRPCLPRVPPPPKECRDTSDSDPDWIRIQS